MEASFKKDFRGDASFRDRIFTTMKAILQAMRMFHYVLGITAPEPKDERKILWIWIVAILLLILLGIGFAFFIITRVLR